MVCDMRLALLCATLARLSRKARLAKGAIVMSSRSPFLKTLGVKDVSARQGANEYRILQCLKADGAARQTISTTKLVPRGNAKAHSPYDCLGRPYSRFFGAVALAPRAVELAPGRFV